MIDATETVRTAPSAVTAPSLLLSVRNIEVVYDNVILVLRGLSMDVPQGAIVALLGANGAGKSTTLKAISGLLKTEDGEFTRSDNEVGADIDMVYNYFPRLKERTGLAGYLSGGEQQMLAIGRALMARPKMILMDEPSMGLSPLLVKEVFAIIKKINRDLGVTILLVEQNARAALSVAGHGYIMEQGKVVL